MKAFWAATMTVYTAPHALESHRLRLLLEEKEVPIRYETLTPDTPWPTELLRVNPNQVMPFITDKNFILYGSATVDEYINERYPYPQLLPYEPTDRAIARFLVDQLRATYTEPPLRSWGTLVEALWSASPWFLGQDFTIVDVAAAPLLHRNRALVAIAPVHVRNYAKRLFIRSAFQRSLFVRSELPICA